MLGDDRSGSSLLGRSAISRPAARPTSLSRLCLERPPIGSQSPRSTWYHKAADERSVLPGRPSDARVPDAPRASVVPIPDDGSVEVKRSGARPRDCAGGLFGADSVGTKRAGIGQVARRTDGV